MKIGIAITVHNRNAIAEKTMSLLREWLPGNAVLIAVDDASIEPFKFSSYRFEKNIGIACSKNKCLELLYNEECTDFFIFDEDCYPTKNYWWYPYTNSGLNHACWNYDRKVIPQPEFASGRLEKYGIAPYFTELQTPNGCMLYFKRICLETVGGWDTDFKGWGYEHVNLSDRIFNAGLTPARYIDAPNTKGLFALHNCSSSVPDNDRMLSLTENRKLYEQNFLSKEYREFRSK